MIVKYSPMKTYPKQRLRCSEKPANPGARVEDAVAKRGPGNYGEIDEVTGFLDRVVARGPADLVVKKCLLEPMPTPPNGNFRYKGSLAQRMDEVLLKGGNVELAAWIADGKPIRAAVLPGHALRRANSSRYKLRKTTVISASSRLEGRKP
jgi:hypothetical protein